MILFEYVQYSVVVKTARLKRVDPVRIRKGVQDGQGKFIGFVLRLPAALAGRDRAEEREPV